MTTTLPNAHPNETAGFWLSSPNVAAAEIASQLGYSFVVLDVEHGSFDLGSLNSFIPLSKGLKLQVFTKVLAPHQAPIQQALDFGSDGVLIPHITDVAHAESICAFAKFAPQGDRSFAGGRTAGYGGVDDAWLERQNQDTFCFPMIEAEGALRDVEAIMSLGAVDGLFLGPSDLSLSRGRGAYARGPEDFQDMKLAAEAASSQGKRWMMSAWSPEERMFAAQMGAPLVLAAMEHAAIVQGFTDSLEAFKSSCDERGN